MAFSTQRLSTTSPAQTVTLTNSGGAPLILPSITISGPHAADSALAPYTTLSPSASSVAPGASCTISVSFTPAATGARAATVNITDDAADSPQSVSLTGTGVTPPTATLSATSSPFGNQRVGTTSPAQTVTLTNSGGAPLNLTSITIIGAQAADFAFAAGNTCPTGAGSVAPGASCTISVSFTPAATGARAATVNITDDAADSPQSVSLTGTGVTPPTATLSATSNAFGKQSADTTSAAQNVTLTNSGGAPLNLTSITIIGAQAADFAFAAGNTCPTGAGSVAPGASCTISASFTPAATGVRAATVNITDDAAGSPQSVSLTGTGVTPPTATLSATSKAFGKQRVGTTSPAQNVTLTNNGGAPLNLISITITGAQAADFAFAAGNTCPSGAGSVAPGASCTISVSFTPAATGVRAATVNITDDAAGSPQRVSLSGTGK